MAGTTGFERRPFRNRTQAVEAALADKLRRPARTRLATESAKLNPPEEKRLARPRPIPVLSHDVFNDRSGTVFAVALTSQEPRAGFPLTLENKATGLTKRSWIKISQIRTLSVDRIGRRLAHASEEEVARVLLGLDEILG